MKVIKGRAARHFAATNGVYLGAYEAPAVPADPDAVEVDAPPPGDVGDFRWNGAVWKKTLAAVERDAEVQAFAYREERAEAYRKRLGKRPGNSPDETIGDVLDALLDFVETGAASPELARILRERAAIKTEIPKPE